MNKILIIVPAYNEAQTIKSVINQLNINIPAADVLVINDCSNDETETILKEENCDFVISLGGGSPHDCAKGIALVATNGGSIKDYEGVNMSLAYCDDCGHQELEMDVCPKCGSRNLTKIDRMNGYLSYSRVHGDTRLNDAKMAEIKERKSM